VLGDARDDGDGLATSPFGFPSDAHYAISYCARPGIAADTFDRATLALRTQSAAVCAVYGLTVAAWGQGALLSNVHIKAASAP
jgi:uncharacterized protein (DUF2141 family)